MQTICANSTNIGGAICVIRVSGDNAINITNRLFRSSKNKELSQMAGYSAHFGRIVESDESIVDEVIVIVYKAPHSYTGEDTTEIMCHASVYIVHRILELLMKQGCRIARPGEFTERAFMNRKMDLSQAEAVADLIAASNEATHRLAMSQMRGDFSHELKNLRNKLLEITSLLELEIDFSEEDIEFADRKQLIDLANNIHQVIQNLINTFRTGNAIKNGIPVAIIGHTNTGKSTLLNRLLHDDRAIVSDIHGTTRDTIEDTINIQGITFRFIDTAGIRESNDQIERIGIERSWQKAREAEIVLVLTDSTNIDLDLSTLSDKHIIKVFNKADIIDYSSFPFDSNSINISAKFGININRLEQMLIKASNIKKVEESNIVITNARHVEALQTALKAITKIEAQLSNGTTSDIIALDIYACIDALSDIVGDVTNEENLHSIFSRFCVGK